MKTYLYLTPNSNGTINDETNEHYERDGVPEGFAVLPDLLLPAWNQYKPFVTMTLVDGAITNIEDNATARSVANTPTLADLRAAALARINGKCESAIEKGVTLDGVGYPMTRGTAQEDLMRAVMRANSVDTAIPYAPHGQFAVLCTAELVRTVDKAFYERGLVNRTYYGLLQAWILQETDAATLGAVDYGAELPKAYKQLLTAQLTSVGIDATALGAMLG